MSDNNLERPSQPLLGFWLGRRSYAEVYALQRQLQAARIADEIADTVLFVEHRPVITLGKAAHSAHLLASPETLHNRGLEVTTTDRGGDITLHAPGQLVCYPIVSLSPHRKDVRRYVKALSEAMRQVTLSVGIDAGLIDGLVGLWVDRQAREQWPGAAAVREPAKVGAIGVKISRWVTMHGFALNLDTDLDLFELIVPCGIADRAVTSIAALNARVPSMTEAAQLALGSLAAFLNKPGHTLRIESELALGSLEQALQTKAYPNGVPA